jgi:hypothetical protein
VVVHFEHGMAIFWMKNVWDLSTTCSMAVCVVDHFTFVIESSCGKRRLCRNLLPLLLGFRDYIRDWGTRVSMILDRSNRGCEGYEWHGVLATLGRPGSRTTVCKRDVKARETVLLLAVVAVPQYHETMPEASPEAAQTASRNRQYI